MSAASAPVSALMAKSAASVRGSAWAGGSELAFCPALELASVRTPTAASTATSTSATTQTIAPSLVQRSRSTEAERTAVIASPRRPLGRAHARQQP